MRRWILLMLLGIVPAFGCSDPARELANRSIDSKAVSFLEKGQEALSMGEYAIALAYVDSASLYEPELAHVDYLRGEVYLATFQTDKADSAFARVFEREKYYRGVWYQRGNAAFLQGVFEEAIEHYRKEQELIAKSPAGIRKLYADIDRTSRPIIEVQLGRCYQKLANADSARAAYDRALAIDSTNATAHAWLAELLQSQGDPVLALQHALTAARLEPDNLEYRYLKGMMLNLNGRSEEALEPLRDVVRRQPWHHSAHYNLGQALQRLGREEEAKFFLTHADTLQNLNMKIEQAQSVAFVQNSAPQRWVILADLYMAVGRVADAYKALQTAHNLLPRNLLIQTDLAGVALARGDTTEAFHRYINVLRQDSTFAYAWLNLGVVYAQVGRYDQARIAWERANRYKPDDPTARTYLARLSR